MKVSEVMNKIVVVETDVTVGEAARIMSENKIGSLVLVKKDKILGILTERDILENVKKTGKKISEIMSRNIFTIEENDSLEHAAKIMAEHKIKRLPVTNKGKLTGIITATEIIENVDDLNEEFFFD